MSTENKTYGKSPLLVEAEKWMLSVCFLSSGHSSTQTELRRMAHRSHSCESRELVFTARSGPSSLTPLANRSILPLVPDLRSKQNLCDF